MAQIKVHFNTTRNIEVSILNRSFGFLKTQTMSNLLEIEIFVFKYHLKLENIEVEWNFLVFGQTSRDQAPSI